MLLKDKNMGEIQMRRKNENELLPKDLKDICNPNVFDFETTKEIEDTSNLIYGQDRGLKALEFGIDIDVKGYNLYIEGPSGVGKTMYAKKYLTKKAIKEKTPNDWCYIYNFEDPNEPVAISFPAGQGRKSCLGLSGHSYLPDPERNF